MQCVVLAAGEGKRMRPLTARRPKVMLPIANRPMMEHLVLAARDAGITDFIFVVGYCEREIRNHFGDGSDFGVRIAYVTQRHQLGTADALRATAGLVGDRFLLLNGDMVLKRDDIRELCRKDAP
ncbi:sugar phosphate nucleotidyltransferase, partial [Methanoculleus sp. UBA45]